MEPTRWHVCADALPPSWSEWMTMYLGEGRGVGVGVRVAIRARVEVGWSESG